jgi:hypothetical protein
MRVRLLSITACVCAAGLVGAADNPLDDARSLLEQWVQARQLVAKTRSDWVAEKDVMDASSRMFERELNDLDAKVAGLGEASEAAGRERQELQAEKELLLAANAKAKALATGYEQQIRALALRLPDPLKQRVQPLLERFPDHPESTRLTAAERLQTLVGLLNEIEKFNDSISVESEVRTNAEGKEIMVETIYLGLAQAYFVGEDGRFAGVAVPGESGWQTTTQNELGPTIARAIAMYRNQEAAAVLALPFEVR